MIENSMFYMNFEVSSDSQKRCVEEIKRIGENPPDRHRFCRGTSFWSSVSHLIYKMFFRWCGHSFKLVNFL